MKIVHIKVTFEDVFSGAILEKTCTRSEVTFEKMKQSIGAIVPRFDNNIKWEWKVIKVEQSK